jgi:hypothetical protein
MNKSKGECEESEKMKKDVEAMYAKKMNESKGVRERESKERSRSNGCNLQER